MTATVDGIHLGPDTHANRPAATAVESGTLYSCSDHDLIYRSDGATWATWATLSGSTPNALSRTAVYRSTNQNVAGSGTLTEISFDTEVVDNAGCWAIGTPTKLVIPAGLNGRVGIVYFHAFWTASAAGNYRYTGLSLNGAGQKFVYLPDNAGGFSIAAQLQTDPVAFATNDEWTAWIQADTTGIGVLGGANFARFGLYTVD